MAAPLVIWDQAMLGYDLGGQHPLDPLRWQLTWALAHSLGVLDGIELFAPGAADDYTLATVHTADYINAVKRASAHPRLPVGHGLGTPDNPAFALMHQTAALIAGGSVSAGLAIARGEVDRAINIAGGLHHAMPAAASGFCVYNDASLAIAAMLAAGVGRVAYVDTDVHHGDGVQAAFYHDPRVLTVSIHESPDSLWPGTGWPEEVGSGAAAGTSVNIPVPPGTGDADWLSAFQAIVPAVLAAFGPDVLVTQHGADSHREDPLADLDLTVDGHRQSYQLLRELAQTHANGRWLALGGGGYSLVRVVPRSWTQLLAVVLDRDVDPCTPTPAVWRTAASTARPDIAVPTSMTDGHPGTMEVRPWDAGSRRPIDLAVGAVREAVFGVLGAQP
ncbi:MAG: acetoin utilization protein AcuC [Actinomycetota bacterium]|nr:acetoin utilization protein AcuC [Actinomycetota bacterium]